MKNIEKYKDDIITSEHSDITCCVNALLHMKCFGDCEECKKYAMKWLLEECKEPILDEAEKEYLSAVIKPFRSRVKYIAKIISYDEFEQRIKIAFYNGYCIYLPYFKANTMYKGMEVDKEYELEELGL